MTSLSSDLELKEMQYEQKRVEKKIDQSSVDPFFLLKIKILEKLVEANSIKDKEQANKLKNEATELIVEYIVNNKYVKTLREDIPNKEMYIYEDGIYIPEAKTYIENICRDIMGHGYTAQFCNKIIDKVQVDTYIKPENFFEVKDEFIIPVLNGLLDVRNDTLSDYDSEYIFTSKLPIIYDKTKKCPNIMNFFKNVLKNPKEDTKTMQELFGYSLIKNYNFQYSFMFLGSGRNGKGVTLDLLKKFLGKDNVSSLSLYQIEKDKFSLANIYNKYANICGDLGKKSLKDTGTFKNLTGQDMIMVDRKFRTMLSFINYAKLVFACNELPYSYDDSDGFYDRWIFFDFPYKFVDDINNLDEKDLNIDKQYLKQKNPKMKEELNDPDEFSGLLNWALEGVKRILENNKFSNSPTTSENRKKWKRQASSFNAFFEDCCEINFNEFTSNENLKIRYQQYCIKHKLKFERNQIINQVLEANCCDQDRQNIRIDNEYDPNLYKTVRGWRGLFLKSMTNMTN